VGFWDFIAPDLETFVDVVAPALPSGIEVRGVVFSAEEVAQAAWFAPGGALGLATRLYYSAQTYQVPRPVTDGLWANIQDQGTAGGFGQGAGFGGSFGYESVRSSGVVTIIPDAYRVSIEAVSGGQAVTNVVGVTNGAGTALGAAQAVQTAWKVATGPLTLLPGSYALQAFRALDMSDPNGDIAVVSDSTAGGGGAVAKSTNAACALVKWNGGTRSRSSRGRLYHGPLSEPQIDADGRTLLPAVRTSLETAYTAFRNSLSASGYPLAVLSLTLSQAFPVTSSSVETIIATQRRRIRS
jgi:hypothetical protein